VSPRALAGLLARNWRLKLSAVVLSIFLWAVVQADSSGLRTVSLPVNIQINEAGWMLVGAVTPSYVEVRLSGPTSEVLRMGFEGTEVTIPINQVFQNDTVVVIQNGWIPTQGFPGVHVEDVIPSTVRLHLEREQTRMIPVRIVTQGEIPAGLALTRAMGLTPNMVRVTGPESLVETVDTLSMISADLGDLTLDGVIEAFVNTQEHPGLSVVPDRVSLGVPVEESLSRVLPGIPVELPVEVEAETTAPGGLIEVVPSTVEVRLEGPRTRVSAVTAEGLRVFVPPNALQGLGPTEERRVPVLVEGIPFFVHHSVAIDTVTVRRTTQ
jgi:YbbR domain-containing protein